MPDFPYLDMKLRRYRNRLRHQTGAPGRALLTLLTLAIIWGSLYGMWRTGLYYIARMPWLDFLVLPSIFSVFFLFLLFLLSASSLVLHTNGLYHAREAELLLHLPISPPRAALYRSIELSLLNSLGGLYVASPLLVAALTMQRPPGGPPVTAFAGAWSLVVLLPAFFVIPNALGAVAAVGARRFGSHVSNSRLVGVATLVGLAGIVWVFAGIDTRLFTDALPPGRLVRLSHDAMASANAWFLPSRWLVRALFAPARGDVDLTLWYGGLLTTLASTCLLAWATVLRHAYYASWLAVNITDSAAAHHIGRPNRMAQWSRWPTFVPERVGTLMLKDALLFLRNGVVRTQGLLLIGPLVLYLLALPAVYSTLGEDRWQTLLIGATNVAAVNVILCAIAARFLLPLVGLEGRKFWLLRMAPPPLSTLVLQKWGFATLVLLAVGQPLVLLSNTVTGSDRVFVAISHLGVLLLAPTIAAICIGMGALFPDLTIESGHRGANGSAAAVALILSLAAAATLMSAVGLAYARFLYSGTFEVLGGDTWDWLSKPAFRAELVRNFLIGAGAGGAVGAAVLALGHARLRRVEIA